MIVKAFSLFDSKAGFFGVPFFAQNVGMAMRSFADLANDPKTMLYKHPEDFSLFLIAEFDDEIGEFKDLQHQNLGNAASFKTPDMLETIRRAMPIKNGEVQEEVAS